MLAEGRLPAVLETLTTRPQPRPAIAGIVARIARSGAMTFSSHAAYQSSSGTSSSSRHLDVPALLTSTSSCPKWLSASARIRSPASASVTSSSRESASPPAAEHASRALSRSAEPRATSSTEAPSAQSWRAVSRPMPRLAPVTTHALPESPRSI
jgi:hypothetical protein